MNECRQMPFYRIIINEIHSLPLSFWKVQDFVGIIDRHRRRLLLNLLLPCFKSVLEQLHLQELIVFSEKGESDE